jgi:cation diffusion facilitator family transporter
MAATALNRPDPPSKRRAAAMSIASNSGLIMLKVVAGTITGSVALLTEAMHSAIDLIASIVAFIAVRKADEPADEDHLYGHEKVENLAAMIEGVLILVGSVLIAFEAIRHLVVGSEVSHLGFGIAVVAISIAVNWFVSARLQQRARETQSAALEADAVHLRTDMATSFGVLVGLTLVAITGANWLDPAVALLIAAAIVREGFKILSRSSRVLVDEALPADELEAISAEIRAFGPQGVAGFHKLRARRAGARRYVDLHVQFVTGTTLEQAHETAHRLQDAIATRIPGADVLIHLEPEDRVTPGTEIRAG